MHGESVLLMTVVLYALAAVVGIAIVLAPLFIWHHLVKLRIEVSNKLQAMIDAHQKVLNESHTLSKAMQDQLIVAKNQLKLSQSQLDEQKKAHDVLMSMQHHYVKSMQYVCDRLADICDSIGAGNDAIESSSNGK